MLEVKSLTKIYNKGRNSGTLAVDNINFFINPNEIVGLLGPNGSGKTTTIKCICSLVTPSSGHIYFEDVDIRRDSRTLKNKIAAVFEGNRNIYWRLTPRENMDFFAHLCGYRLADFKDYREKLIKKFDLLEKADTQARMLSRGMQQKLALCCALVKKTPFLILDEPTLGLDVSSSREFIYILKELAKKKNKTILLSSHDMRIVQEVCDRVIIMNKGKIIRDDSIGNLNKIFAAHAYRFVLSNELTSGQTKELTEEFNTFKIETSSKGIILEIGFVDGIKFYKLFEILKSGNSKIESIKNLKQDFEDVFIQVIKDDA